MRSKLQQSVDRYLTYLKAEENKSPLTIKAYRESLGLLCKLCSVDDPLLFSKQVIRIYKSELHSYHTRTGGELSIRSKNHHLTILRAFLKYLRREEELDVYPPDGVTRFKEDPRRVKVLEMGDLLRLLAEPSTETKEGKRDSAIFELFFSTGLRLAELRSLNRRDINFQTREMSIRGKRGKIRVVFLSGRAVDSLRSYMNIRLDHLDPLFIRALDKAVTALPPGEEFRFSANGIYRMMKKYVLKAGIVQDPSPHTLRHTFATNLLKNGADLRSIQEMLGHKDLSTTQIYTHVTNPQLKEVHDKFHHL